MTLYHAIVFRILPVLLAVSSGMPTKTALATPPRNLDVCGCGNATINTGNLLPGESVNFDYYCAGNYSGGCNPCKWTVSATVSITGSAIACYSQSCWPDRVSNCTTSLSYTNSTAVVQYPLDCAATKEFIVWIKHKTDPGCGQADTHKSITIACQACQ
jgi:hypothetical protein